MFLLASTGYVYQHQLTLGPVLEMFLDLLWWELEMYFLLTAELCAKAGLKKKKRCVHSTSCTFCCSRILWLFNTSGDNFLQIIGDTLGLESLKCSSFLFQTQIFSRSKCDALVWLGSHAHPRPLERACSAMALWMYSYFVWRHRKQFMCEHGDKT